MPSANRSRQAMLAALVLWAGAQCAAAQMNPPREPSGLPQPPTVPAAPQPATVPQISVPIGKPADAAASAEAPAARCDMLHGRKARADCRRDAARQAARAPARR